MLFWMMASMMVPLAVVMQMVGLEDQLRGAGEADLLQGGEEEDQLQVGEVEAQLLVGAGEAQLLVGEAQLVAAASPMAEVDCVTVVVVEHLLAEAVVPLEVVEVEPAYLCCRVGLWVSETNLINVVGS